MSLGSIATTKLLVITNSETLYTLGSGNVALEATNLGPNTVYYGNSGVLNNSGGLIIGNGSKFWDSVVGDFKVRFVVSSGTSQLVIHEYAGN
jgi:hypothetical protein